MYSDITRSVEMNLVPDTGPSDVCVKLVKKKQQTELEYEGMENPLYKK